MGERQSPTTSLSSSPSGGAAPAWLEKIREVGLSIDRDGHFLHEGERVTHPGLLQALFRWLDRLPPPDGRHILWWDRPRYAYVTVEDTPLVVRGARIDDASRGMSLTLSDGTETLLDASTLRLREDGALVCRVREGRLEARFATPALAAIEDHLGEDEAGPYLRLAGKRWRMRQTQDADSLPGQGGAEP